MLDRQIFQPKYPVCNTVVLLSFAQFEREVTGERIRDKIAASKRKGMWMGGTVPLGYESKERKLIVNAEGQAGASSLPSLS